VQLSNRPSLRHSHSVSLCSFMLSSVSLAHGVFQDMFLPVKRLLRSRSETSCYWAS
jgi:hypothetical protein